MNAYQHLEQLQKEFAANNKSDLHNRVSQIYCLGDKEAYQQIYDALSYAIEAKCNTSGIDDILCFHQQSRGTSRYEAKLFQLFTERYEHNPIIYQKVIRRAIKEAKVVHLTRAETPPFAGKATITCNGIVIGYARLEAFTSYQHPYRNGNDYTLKLRSVELKRQHLLASRGMTGNNAFTQRLPFHILFENKEIRNAWIIDMVNMREEPYMLTCEIMNLQAETMLYR